MLTYHLDKDDAHLQNTEDAQIDSVLRRRLEAGLTHVPLTTGIAVGILSQRARVELVVGLEQHFLYSYGLYSHGLISMPM